ncbi:MAG: hypothetical protein HFE76_16765 [Firmicutes bacterium]|nr:hypothetical protein [Bacillota bacterium]
MATLNIDRKKPDTAIPQLVQAVNSLLPVGMLVKVRGNPPKIGTWKAVSKDEAGTEYERVR